MAMRSYMAKVVCIAALSLLMIPDVFARTFEFKAAGTKSTGVRSDNWWGGSQNSRRSYFQVKVGSAQKNDDKKRMEIRAATLMKDILSRKVDVNDVATISFEPVNVKEALQFGIVTGMAIEHSRSEGYQVAGCIIEIWQGGKMLKHWSNVSGTSGKTRLVEGVKMLKVRQNGWRQRDNSYEEFDNPTEIFAINKKGEKVDVDDLVKEYSAPEDESKTVESTVEQGTTVSSDKSDENKDNDVAEGEFILKSFCGFEFGSQKPAFSGRNNGREITLRKPFRHYTRARLEYGVNSGQLHTVWLMSNQRFDSDMARTEAAAAAAAVIEKKYGITMEDCGSSFNFCDERHNIWVQATHITVQRCDLKEKDEILRNAIRDATKRQIKTAGNADDGSDVL